MSTPDPLSPKALPGPGLRQWLREAFTGRPTPLLCMQVEVSSVCACRCTYCPHTTKKDVWQSRLMSAETFAALWPLMRQCGRVHLQGWGEPFLHPRFMDFVSVARRAGCAVSTTTCGQHMDESLAAAIVDSGMDVVAFSLAGTDEASNASRQGIPFSRVCEAIRCLQEVRRKKQGVHLEVHLAYLLLPSQLEAVKRLPELMEELDVHCAVVSTMDYIASPELAVEAYSPEEADKVAAAAAVLAPVAARVRQSGRELWYALPDPEAVGRVRNGCRENVDRTIYVDTQGNLSPCVYVNLPTSEDDPKRRIFARAEYGRPAGELAEPNIRRRGREPFSAGAAAAHFKAAAAKPFVIADELGGAALADADYYDALIRLLFSGKPLVGVLRADGAPPWEWEELHGLLARDPDTLILHTTGIYDINAAGALRHWTNEWARP